MFKTVFDWLILKTQNSFTVGEAHLTVKFLNRVLLVNTQNSCFCDLESVVLHCCFFSKLRGVSLTVIIFHAWSSHAVCIARSI